jgi:hypothetical protein
MCCSDRRRLGQGVKLAEGRKLLIAFSELLKTEGTPFKWPFPQEKATLHASRKVDVDSENAVKESTIRARRLAVAAYT